MARRTAMVTIDAEGRDRGKVFKLTEMPASRVEDWAARAFLAMARSGVDVPINVTASGLQGLAAMGPSAFQGMTYADLKPLLEEMFECVQIQPDARNPQVIRGLVDDDIEEIATRLHLRMEVWKLHTGFSQPAGQSISDPASRKRAAS